MRSLVLTISLIAGVAGAAEVYRWVDDDGQVHFFNAGLPSLNDGVVEFDRGTGEELASFIPRATLSNLRRAARNADSPQYGVDQTPRISDVFIDPVHDVSASVPPDPAQREWRTVLVSGLRQGGHSVIALDITQPDRFSIEGADSVALADGGSAVPSCAPTRTGTSNPISRRAGIRRTTA